MTKAERRILLSLEVETSASLDFLDGVRSAVLDDGEGHRRTVKVLQSQANVVRAEKSKAAPKVKRAATKGKRC